MTIRPDKAFILAAGMGTRLRPYTDHCPKPLVKLNGKPIIDHVLDRLKAANVQEVTVNLHYMADMLAEHLHAYKGMEIKLSFEDTLLDTGGGIKNALPDTNGAPFYIVAGDSVWMDGPGKPALARMADIWAGGQDDLLLMLQPLDRMPLTPGKGDYTLQPNGICIRSLDRSGPYMWTSVRLCTPNLFKDTPDAPFSFLTLMDRAQDQGKLHGLVHDGEWYHITTPDDLDRVNEALAGKKRALA
jgi:MurNAc alpha-1-phosphate uridylyltransferase